MVRHTAILGAKSIGVWAPVKEKKKGAVPDYENDLLRKNLAEDAAQALTKGKEEVFCPAKAQTDFLWNKLGKGDAYINDFGETLKKVWDKSNGSKEQLEKLTGEYIREADGIFERLQATEAEDMVKPKEQVTAKDIAARAAVPAKEAKGAKGATRAKGAKGTNTKRVEPRKAIRISKVKGKSLGLDAAAASEFEDSAGGPATGRSRGEKEKTGERLDQSAVEQRVRERDGDFRVRDWPLEFSETARHNYFSKC